MIKIGIDIATKVEEVTGMKIEIEITTEDVMKFGEKVERPVSPKQVELAFPKVVMAIDKNVKKLKDDFILLILDIARFQ